MTSEHLPFLFPAHAIAFLLSPLGPAASQCWQWNHPWLRKTHLSCYHWTNWTLKTHLQHHQNWEKCQTNRTAISSQLRVFMLPHSMLVAWHLYLSWRCIFTSLRNLHKIAEAVKYHGMSRTLIWTLERVRTLLFSEVHSVLCYKILTQMGLKKEQIQQVSNFFQSSLDCCKFNMLKNKESGISYQLFGTGLALMEWPGIHHSQKRSSALPVAKFLEGMSQNLVF